MKQSTLKRRPQAKRKKLTALNPFGGYSTQDKRIRLVNTLKNYRDRWS